MYIYSNTFESKQKIQVHIDCDASSLKFLEYKKPNQFEQISKFCSKKLTKAYLKFKVFQLVVHAGQVIHCMLYFTSENIITSNSSC